MDIDFSSSVGFHGLLHICVVQPTATAKEYPLYPCVAMRGKPLHKEVSIVIVEIVLVRDGFDEAGTRPGEVPLANVAPRCRCCCWCLAWLSSVFCKLPVLPPVSNNIATSCCAFSLFLFSYVDRNPCDGMLRDYCCLAECLGTDRDERRDGFVKNVSKPQIFKNHYFIMILKINLRRTNYSFESSEYYPCFQLFA